MRIVDEVIARRRENQARFDAGSPTTAAGWPVQGRNLIGNLYTPLGKGNGTCRWCGTPTASGRISWHETCAIIYQIAKGATQTYGRPVIDTRGPCASCGVEGRGLDVDHRLALGIAARLGDRRSTLRAWWIGNLQAICDDCHRTKTTADRRVMALLDAGVSYENALAEAAVEQRSLAL